MIAGKSDSEKSIAQTSCAAKLLDWYDRHQRRLPWRALPGHTADPYAVWLSEIMLQQTNVTTVKPYYTKFLELWPTVEALAASPVEEVMKAWAGLGYYSRARNLHLCAKMVVSAHKGRFPANLAGLRNLPGIGPYTSAAIASIAFGEPATVVDGNVERVISRLFAVETPLPAAKPQIYALAADLTPKFRAGDYAQAMMDLGATICTPRNPACAICPLMDICAARQMATPAIYPRKLAKAVRPTRSGAAFMAMREDGAVLVRRRPDRGLLGGMLEVPTTDWSTNTRAASYRLETAILSGPIMAEWKACGSIEHVFTHFTLILDVFSAKFPATIPAPPGSYFLDAEALEGEAFPSVFRKVMEKSGSV